MQGQKYNINTIDKEQKNDLCKQEDLLSEANPKTKTIREIIYEQMKKKVGNLFLNGKPPVVDTNKWISVNSKQFDPRS